MGIFDEDKNNELFQNFKKLFEDNKTALEAILSRNLKVKHKYQIDGHKELEESLKSHENALKGLYDDIPKEIKIKKETTISFKDATKKYLLIFFSVSILVVGLSLFRAIDLEINKNKIVEKKYNNLRKKYANSYLWLENYHKEIKKKAPKSTKDFIQIYGEKPPME